MPKPTAAATKGISNTNINAAAAIPITPKLTDIINLSIGLVGA